MTYEVFVESIALARPPAGLHPVLEALWHEQKGYWQRAHDVVQRQEGVAEYDHLHGYLHRKEGDQFNAGYWYRRAGVPIFVGSLEDEWTALVLLYL